MESSHFLAISSPWQKLQNVVLRIFICCHGNEIWAIFAKITNCFFFFVFRWNRAIFWPLVQRDPLYKTFFDFWFRPPKPQNWLPKIWPKIAYNSACMADRPEMFAPNRGFSGMADSMEPCTMFRADPCCYGNDILANLGYFSTKSPMSRLVCQIDQICLGLPAETNSGPTSAAKATTSETGAESNRLPACLSVWLYVCL